MRQDDRAAIGCIEVVGDGGVARIGVADEVEALQCGVVVVSQSGRCGCGGKRACEGQGRVAAVAVEITRLMGEGEAVIFIVAPFEGLALIKGVEVVIVCQ